MRGNGLLDGQPVMATQPERFFLHRLEMAAGAFGLGTFDDRLRRTP
jgi:hypothetical protein